MAPVFRDCGRIDLELRDLIGGGHARLLTLVPTRRFDGLLRKVAGGSNYCGIAITEPETGSDMQSLSTSANPIPEGYRLEGQKQCIARLEEASHFIVFAAVSRPTSQPLISMFLVPRNAAGLEFERVQSMGLSAVSWGRVWLRKIVVPSSFRIGGEGQGLSLFLRHFCYWRTMMAAAAIGSAQAAIEQAATRMQSRMAFGAPIGRFSHLQQGLAEHIARLRMAWLLVESVAALLDSRHWPLFDAAMVKAEAVEAAIAATEWSMGVFGGAAYGRELGIEKRYRDLIGLRFADGTTDVLRGQVARAVLGERLYELSLNRKAIDQLNDSPHRRFW
jgi:alkylation response protein AidB-like acyl-CoA dehydrogenase